MTTNGCPRCRYPLRLRVPAARSQFTPGSTAADVLRCPCCGEEWTATPEAVAIATEALDRWDARS